MLGDSLSKFELIAMVCSFAGIILIMISKPEKENEQENDVSSISFYIGCICILGLSIGTAFIGNFTRRM